jgi:hypothetical protein
VGQTIVGSLLALAGSGLLVLGQRIDEVPGWVPPAVGVTMLSTGIATIGFLALRRTAAAVAAPAAGFVVAYLVTAFFIYPAMQPRKSARPLARELAEVSAASRAAGRPVLAYRLGNLPEALAFYGDGLYTVETGDPAALERHLGRSATVFAVADGAALDELSGETRRRIRVLSRYRLGKEVWLISNEGSAATSP